MNRETRTWISGIFYFLVGANGISVGVESLKNFNFGEGIPYLVIGLFLAIHGVKKVDKTID